MTSEGRVIDVAVRFLRTNPELIAYAHGAAPGAGKSVQELLEDAVALIRSVPLRPIESRDESSHPTIARLRIGPPP